MKNPGDSGTSTTRLRHVYSVSRSLKKGQGATPKKGNLNARQPMSKGQPLDVATHVKQQENMCQGQIKIFIITLIQFTVLIVFELWFDCL